MSSLFNRQPKTLDEQYFNDIRPLLNEDTQNIISTVLEKESLLRNI
ncbi:MAG: hypothetical protein HC820_01825 [Hydrococcus sp. RM1_1_31]|nr:hypothetical protein [Hydrococcus sp. RM1_1_31]